MDHEIVEHIADIVRDAREARHLGRLETVLRLQRNLTDYLKFIDDDFDERAFEIRCMSRELAAEDQKRSTPPIICSCGCGEVIEEERNADVRPVGWGEGYLGRE